MRYSLYVLVFITLLVLIATPAFANGQNILCEEAVQPCLLTPDPCGCKLNPPNPELEGPDSATVGSVFSVRAGTGRASFCYSISSGSINPLTGEITAAPAECAATTVAVTDACSNTDSRDIQMSFDSTFKIDGSEEPEVGDFYSATGGSGDYSYSFTGGSINSDTGEITEITACGGPNGNGAVASVSVSDGCGNSASITVRLPGGSWHYTNKIDQPVSCLGANPSPSWVWYDQQISGGTMYRVSFTHGNTYLGNCEADTTCKPMEGWSVKRCVTASEYFSEGPLTGTIRYSIILPCCVRYYEWMCN